MMFQLNATGSLIMTGQGMIWCRRGEIVPSPVETISPGFSNLMEALASWQG